MQALLNKPFPWKWQLMTDPPTGWIGKTYMQQHTVISYSIIIMFYLEIMKLQWLYLPATLSEEHKVKEFNKRKWCREYEKTGAKKKKTTKLRSSPFVHFTDNAIKSTITMGKARRMHGWIKNYIVEVGWQSPQIRVHLRDRLMIILLKWMSNKQGIRS